MFNERDRRCAAVQLMLSTDPSYDNMTIASTFKMQIWRAMNNRDVTRVKSVVIPWCNQVAGGRPCLWQQDSTPAYKSKEIQDWLQKECNDFVPFSHCTPRPKPAGLLRLVIRREHHQHDLPQHQGQLHSC